MRFASIGIGNRHADSHFMLSRHSSGTTLPETTLSVYTAEKKAEIAPGAGYDTNMFSVGPTLGSFSWVTDSAQKGIHALYSKALKSHQRTTLLANKGMEAFAPPSQVRLRRHSSPEGCEKNNLMGNPPAPHLPCLRAASLACSVRVRGLGVEGIRSSRATAS